MHENSITQYCYVYRHDNSQSKAFMEKHDPSTTFLKVKLALVDLFCYYQKDPNKNCSPVSIDNCINRMELKILMRHQDVRTNKFT